jgi:N-methylhydantoinase B
MPSARTHPAPLTCVERYALRDGSGGHGERRGGAGVVREYRILGDGISISLSSERQHVAAPGLLDGGFGACGRFVLDPGTESERVLPSAVADLELPRGSVLAIATPGGGGCGTPSERDRAVLDHDVREGRITADEAQGVYGRSRA